MKARVHPLLLTCGISLALPLLFPAIPASAAPPTGSATRAPATPDLAAAPQSIFVVPASPKEGRNPFFPHSAANVPAPQPKPNAIDAAAFILNGITGPPKRTAMINGRTFEQGEEGEVRLPNGTKTLIKCAEIKTNSAVIEVSGQRRELTLRAGF